MNQAAPLSKIVVFAVVSWLVVIALIMFVIRRREASPPCLKVVLVGFIVGPVGVLLAKYGSYFGLPWWIYYAVPMLGTVALPPVIFHLRRGEVVTYLLLSFLSAPVIHTAFALTLGWREYMPFMPWP
jgi:hypothetical protein